VAEPIDELRAAAARVASVSPALAPYLEKVRVRAYAVTDGDVDRLRGAGLTEDEIFEQTVAAAVTEGLRRLDAARRALA
jgi:alkylhydroperoxidase family enzyme